MIRTKGVKEAIRHFLADEDYDSLVDLALEQGGRVVNGLIGTLAGPDEEIRWRAVRALGLVTARLYALDPERGYWTIRQLIWNLSSESGGIGWGMPEAFGEILALSPPLRERYLPLLVSYLTEERLAVENQHLVAGLIWAVGRVKEMDKETRDRIVPVLRSALTDSQATLKGLAAWTLGQLGAREALEDLRSLGEDDRRISLLESGVLRKAAVRDLVREAVENIEPKKELFYE